MIKRQFIGKVAALSKLTAEQVKAALAALQSVAAEELAADGATRIPGLTTLKVMARSERLARNPKTGTPCTIVPGHTVKSRPVSALTSLVVKNIETGPVQF